MHSLFTKVIRGVICLIIDSFQKEIHFLIKINYSVGKINCHTVTKNHDYQRQLIGSEQDDSRTHYFITIKAHSIAICWITEVH